MSHPATKRVLSCRAAALLTTVLFLFVAVTGAQRASRAQRSARNSAAHTQAGLPNQTAPFQAGETLEYRVLLSKYAVNAARVETAVIDQGNFFGRLAWHFRVIAHTVDTTRLLFPLDDQFDSYTSVANLISVQYEMYLHEQGKQQTSRYRMTGEGEPAPADATALRVLPGTRDAIGFLYALRSMDWQRTPEFRAPVFDGRRLYDAIARVEVPRGTASVAAGTFTATRIAIRLFDHGKELTDTRLWVWIANDAARTPVLIEADIPYGACRIELTRKP